MAIKGKKGAAFTTILLIVVVAITLLLIGFKLGKGGAGSGNAQQPSPPVTQPPDSPPITPQKPVPTDQFIVIIDKATYILPEGEILENVELLIERIKKLPTNIDVVINAKRASIRGSSQIQKALNEAGIPYKWEE